MSQKSIAEACSISSETVNRLVTKLQQFRAIKKRPQGFRVVNSGKILQYWAATRDLHGDIVWTTYTAYSMDELESELPEGSVLTAYSGYRKRFGESPRPYNKVYVYARQDEVRRRFSEPKAEERDLVVLRHDPHIGRLNQDGVAPMGQLYVDLWQIGTSTADRFLKELEEKLEPKPSEVLKILAGRGRRFRS